MVIMDDSLNSEGFSELGGLIKDNAIGWSEVGDAGSADTHA